MRSKPTALRPRRPAGPTDDLAVVVDAAGRVVVLDVETGDEVRELSTGVRRTVPAVSPDGGTLAYVRYEDVDDDQRPGLPEAVLMLRDLTGGARRLGPDLQQRPDGTSWGPAAALGQGRLAVVETCCAPPTDEPWTVIAVDGTEGTTEGAALIDEGPRPRIWTATPTRNAS